MHNSSVIMSAMAFQIINLTIVYSTVYIRHRSKKTSRLRVIGPLCGEFTGQMFPFDDVMMVPRSPCNMTLTSLGRHGTWSSFLKKKEQTKVPFLWNLSATGAFPPPRASNMKNVLVCVILHHARLSTGYMYLRIFFLHINNFKHFRDGPTISFQMTDIICERHPGNITHRSRDKMDAISQTTFLSAFSLMKMFEFWLKFQWNLFIRV